MLAVLVELADPAAEESRLLLCAHEDEMAARYPTERWAGTTGRKDAFWVARGDDGHAVGCVALRVLAPVLVEVKHLYVEPAARRAGVARVLMDALEAEARRRHSGIVLETGIEQPEAVALYRSRGYQDRDRYEECDVDGEGSVYLERLAGCAQYGDTVR